MRTAIQIFSLFLVLALAGCAQRAPVGDDDDTGSADDDDSTAADDDDTTSDDDNTVEFLKHIAAKDPGKVGMMADVIGDLKAAERLGDSEAGNILKPV